MVVAVTVRSQWRWRCKRFAAPGANVAELVANNTILTFETFLPYRLSLLSAMISQGLQHSNKGHELAANELFVLIALGQLGAMTARALGAKCQMHKTKVSRLVARLSKRGHVSVQTNALDRRATIIDLTPSGKVLYDQYASGAAEFSRALEDAIPVEDRDALDRSLTKLAHRARQLSAMTPYDHRGGNAPR